LKEILRVVLRYVGVSEINAGALLTGIGRRKLNHDQWTFFAKYRQIMEEIGENAISSQPLFNLKVFCS
jgi:hypothetical protein